MYNINNVWPKEEKNMMLDEMIEKLHVCFADPEVNIDIVKHVMESYESDINDWEKYAYFSPHRWKKPPDFAVKILMLVFDIVFY